MLAFTFALLSAVSLPPPPAQDSIYRLAKEYILSIAGDKRSVAAMFFENDLIASQRLGISYEGVTNKFLIGDEIDSSIIGGIRDHSLSYEVRIDSSEDGNARAILSVPRLGYQHPLYFRGRKATSRISYFTRTYHTWHSKHFKFLLSDTTQFNRYSVNHLELFLDSIATLLKFTKEDLDLLEKEKIVYVLCRDESEIEQVTGFKTLGMYILAYDYVVTTFNCHYHELLHVLINFKLKHLPLYTHPMLQEGFAVAFGGRGGREPAVMLDAGYFLAKSAMVEVSSLLRRKEFLQQDASVSYPVSGLYNLFLVKELGIIRYLHLYRTFSMTGDRIDAANIDSSDLPPSDTWRAFLDGYVQHEEISLAPSATQARPVIDTENGRIVETAGSYVVRLKDTLLLSSETMRGNYTSKRFAELFPTRTYMGEKYAIVATPQEISIYNLYTNNLIANLVGTFCLPPIEMSKKDGMFEFQVKKSIFDEKPDDVPVIWTK